MGHCDQGNDSPGSRLGDGSAVTGQAPRHGSRRFPEWAVVQSPETGRIYGVSVDRTDGRDDVTITELDPDTGARH